MTMPDPTGGHRLSRSDRNRLEKLEQVVERGLATFVTVGRALMEIRDRRLYRETHSRFDDYCRDRFGIGRHYAYRQIRGAEVTATLADVDNCQQVDCLPANEAQARPLTTLEPEEVRRAWLLAVELSDGGQPTSGDVKRAVELVTENGGPARAGDADSSVHFSSESGEWLSPPSLVERVQEVMGRITLDPCAASHASPVVPAESHLTEEDDGLARDWSGSVYMNPPYGRAIEEWVEKLISEYEEGGVTEAVALLPARTDTSWFRRLRPYPRCFLHGRLTFSGHANSAPFPSMTVYLGTTPQEFISAFSQIGDVYVAVDKA